MILARLAELPPDARELAAALSVVGEAVPLPVAGRIARIDHPAEALEALLGTGFVAWWPGEASTPACFTHPLYRAALYADLAPTRRRELHRAAAESLDAASALRHRVAAAEGTDDDLARDLDESAAGGASEGARSMAATYLLWASSVGSGPQLNERRVLRAARLLLEDGQTARAAELRGRVEGCGEGPLRSLVLGQLLAARGGRRRQAVDQLRLARDLFAKAGAEPSLRRVEADLASQKITVSRPGSRSPLELTDRERDVAVLVAKGMTNREVAAQLYVSPKAVDYHLGHIFGKLGITSRRDLRQQAFS